MTEYIERKKIWSALNMANVPYNREMEKAIESIPAADVIERKKHIVWQYCKDLNDINEAIETEDGNWEQLKSADQIISVTYDTNHGLYVVIWRIPDEEDEHGSN